jgi:hypothetical protein
MTAPPILPIPHNWRERAERTITWPTDVQRSRSGEEQRFQLADKPVERLRYYLTLDHPRSATRLLSVLAQATDGRIRIPRWEDGVRLTQQESAEATALSALLGDPALRSFEAGAEAIVWRGVDEWEVVTLEGVETGALTLEEPGLSRQWGQGTWVIPLVSAVLVGQLDAQRYGTASEVPIEVRIAPATAAGQAEAAVVASLTREPGSPTVVNGRRTLLFRIVARDARGVMLPDVPVEVSHTHPDRWHVHAGVVPGTVVARHYGTTGVSTGQTEVTVSSGAASLNFTLTAAT